MPYKSASSRAGDATARQDSNDTTTSLADTKIAQTTQAERLLTEHATEIRRLGKRDLIALYVGDYDPSGMFMSVEDLPTRLAKYGGSHVRLKRIALKRQQVIGLPSFPVTDKRKDPRYKWFLSNYGVRCWG
jgi:hypothetical protein